MTYYQLSGVFSSSEDACILNTRLLLPHVHAIGHGKVISSIIVIVVNTNITHLEFWVTCMYNEFGKTLHYFSILRIIWHGPWESRIVLLDLATIAATLLTLSKKNKKRKKQAMYNIICFHEFTVHDFLKFTQVLM